MSSATWKQNPQDVIDNWTKIKASEENIRARGIAPGRNSQVTPRSEPSPEACQKGSESGIRLDPAKRFFIRSMKSSWSSRKQWPPGAWCI